MVKPSLGENVEQWELSDSVDGSECWKNTFEILTLSEKLNIQVPYDLQIPLVIKCAIEMYSHILQESKIL